MDSLTRSKLPLKSCCVTLQPLLSAYMLPYAKVHSTVQVSMAHWLRLQVATFTWARPQLPVVLS